jgi:hypothetical protein
MSQTIDGTHLLVVTVIIGNGTKFDMHRVAKPADKGKCGYERQNDPPGGRQP